MERFWQDLRYGMRMLRKSPSHTVVAALSLALGLGASTALFSVYDAVVLRPLPVANPDQLAVFIWQAGENASPQSYGGFGVSDGPGTPRLRGSFSFPLFQQMRQQNVMSHTFAFYDLGRSNVQVDGVSELASALLVSGDYFDGLGLIPSAGRLLAPPDDRIGGEPVAVISHAYWLKRFGGDAATVGRAIFVNGQPFTVAGIGPRDFYGTIDYTATPEIFLPVAYIERLRSFGRENQNSVLEDNEWWTFGVMGRLKAGRRHAASGAVGAEPSLLKRRRQFAIGTQSQARRQADRSAQPAAQVRRARPVGISPPQRADADGGLSCGRTDPADRVRQRGQPVAGTRGRAAARSGRAHGAGLAPAAADPSIAHREFDASGYERLAGCVFGVVGQRAAFSVAAGQLGSAVAGDSAGFARACVRGYRLCAHSIDFWAGACVTRHARGFDNLAERSGGQHCRESPAPAAGPGDGCGATRTVCGGAGGRGAAAAHADQLGEFRRRLQRR